MITTRDEITKILNNDSVGCELGVFEGEFSNILLNSKKFKKLYLVDTFEGLIMSGSDWNNIKHKDGNDLLNTVTNKFSKNENVEIVKLDSVNFLNRCEDEYFDFIYIDTCHTYDQTKKELNLSFKKIKKNGIIAGHDYDQQCFPGVVQAVNEFAAENNLTLKLTTKDFLETFYFIL